VLRAALIAILMVLNLIPWGTLVFLGGLPKLLSWGSGRRRVIQLMSWFGERWVQGNDQIFDWLLDTRWEVEGLDELRRDGHYLVISNHVSWVDIFALNRAFLGRGPFIRFFMKRPLLWFPIAGQACWALEFPFMRRYTPEYLKRYPEKRGLDLETTKIACRRYRQVPVAILNFLEGTRFTRSKHDDQQSPYRHLLRPRVGGIGFVLASFAEQLDAMYDITLVYPHRDVTLWHFLTNRLEWVRLEARRIPVPAKFFSAGITEPGPARDDFKQWVDEIWREKDARIEELVSARH
jgi:1-acyl-sn-glycerol-3-phosphate acyltransferase